MTNESPHSVSPVKIERIKRSWTQEFLAQKTGLSSRTIQRIERGESAHAESLRLIAEAMEIDIESLKQSALRLHYNSPWSKSLKITTSVVLGLMLISAIVTLRTAPWLLQLLIIISLCCLAFSIQGYSLLNNQLVIHRMGWSTRVPLQDILEFEVNPHVTMGSIRLFGIGGLFANVGLFRNDILGKYHAFVTDSKNSLVVKTNKQTFVITPDNPLQMSKTIESLIAGSLND